VIHVAKAL